VKYPFDFFEAALADAEDAIASLDEQRPGYGRKFYDALYQIIQSICEKPKSFPKTQIRPDLRKALLPKPFQKTYSVVYLFDGETVYIVSVFHNSRDPRVWQNR
jgi:plasmid stabilization system protein ParE